MTKREIVTCIFLLLKGLLLQAQTYPLKGRVVDINNQPILGASIQSMTDSILSNSDQDGYFEMHLAHAKGMLTVSHVLYTAKVVLYEQAESLLLIRLEPKPRLIDEVEVVHTGYQHIPKERATGSFVSLSTEDLQQRVTPNILESIEGYMPTLQFEKRSGGMRTSVRGLSSLNHVMMGLLIVLDNFPYEGDLKNINPNDIASVTLLRDAAATSIWGARAGNGVLVITRKQPKAGELTLNYSNNLRIKEKPRLFEVPGMNSSEFLEVESFLYDQGFYKNLFNPRVNKNRIISPYVNLLEQHAQGEVSSQELDDFVARASELDYRHDLLKYAYRAERYQQHTFSMMGGNEQTSYRASLGYDYMHADQVHNHNNRLTLSQSFQQRISRNLQLNTSLDLSSTRKENDLSGIRYPLNPGGRRIAYYPYAELLDADGNFAHLPKDLNTAYLERIWTPDLLDWTYSPLAEIGKSNTENKGLHILGTAALKYTLFDWLKLEGLYGFESQREDGQTVYAEDAYYTRNLVNTFTQVKDGVYSYPLPRGGILGQGNSRLNGHRARAMASVDKGWSNKHHLALIVGTEVNASRSLRNGHREYGYDDRILKTQPVDFVTSYRTFDGILGTQRIANSMNHSEISRRFVSLFSNAAYTYQNRYMLSGSARRDASNVFGVNTNERWKPLWSLGAAWILSKESWLVAQPWLTNLKLRTTYGHSGNAGGISSSHALIRYISDSDYALSNFPRAQVTALRNPSLKWEDVAMLNLALDLSILKGRLSGSFEYFTKVSSDLLADEALDPTVGFSRAVRNVGRMKGKGFDAAVRANLGNERFTWIVDANLTKNRSKVIDYYGSSSNASYYTSSLGTLLAPLEGKSPFPVFAYRFAGLDSEDGSPLGFLEDEVSTEYSKILSAPLETLHYYGTSMAPYVGSLRNSIRWRELQFSWLITFKFGHFKQKNTILYGGLFNTWETHADFSKRWLQPGDEAHTTVPSMTYPSNTSRDNFYARSEANIYKADFIRLQDIRLAYRLPLQLGTKRSNISLNATLNQLGILWRASSQVKDPENEMLPAPRNLSIGLLWNY